MLREGRAAFFICGRWGQYVGEGGEGFFLMGGGGDAFLNMYIYIYIAFL